MICFTLLLSISAPVQRAPQTVAEVLRPRVEQLHDTPGAAVRGVRLLRPDAVVHFLESRAFEPPWNAEGIDQIREAILAIEQDGLAPADYHIGAIDALKGAHAGAPDSADVADLQILVTDAVAGLVDHVRYGKVRPVTLDRRWNVDPRSDAPPLEQVLAGVASAASPAHAIESLKPDHFVYVGLKRALGHLRSLVGAGGWPAVPAGPTLKAGDAGTRVRAARRRLQITGELSEPDESDMFDAALETAVRTFQERHRLAEDGRIGAATLQAMNVPAAARANQVRVNLERARWVLGGLKDSFVLVNLPAFKVYLIRDRRNVWEARTQIGREARQTPAFRADMRYLVFNPDWTVPPTILAEDVLTGMRRGQNTIAKKKLTILDRQDRIVDPSTIDWSAATPRDFPYILRQPPGADNALGRVKFVFPNEHAIFLHDTPSQDLFQHDTRTFSSGCIRVESALDLASHLLALQDGWTRERVQQAVDEGKTQTIFLRDPLPVLIVYWTVTVGASGDLHFARDVYKHDAPLLRALSSGSASP